ncbi:hypothetical protein RR48_06732 [Papilio machaon]|uniref:Uncharacterized protein n=1 Tax=Papilio machaon TaxID=76193 RepID=A0A194R6T7_PAPMA|nr:hypothetical protein RR48_06732 [Papilio machaon]
MSSTQLVEGEVENDGDGWAPQLPRLHQPLHTQVSPPPPVAMELEVATTDMWCHTNRTDT